MAAPPSLRYLPRIWSGEAVSSCDAIALDLGMEYSETFGWLSSVVTQLGPPLTVLGILLALWALREARRQTKLAVEQTDQLAGHEQRLASIWRSLSTRYLGQFPLYTSEIAELLERAKQDVTIFCDLPGYGVFSDRSSWLRIQHVIQRKIQDGVKFDVTVYSERQRETIIREQMDQREGGVENWLRSDEAEPYLLAFVRNYGGMESLEEITPEVYLRVSLQAHQQIALETFRGSKVKEVDDKMPLYFWMIDGREAIISIPIFIGESTEHGFRTSDQSFIAALVDLKKKYMAESAG